MKTGKILVLICLITAILMSSAFSVSADETDWANVDWSQVDWYAIDYNQVDWESADIGAMIRAMYSRLDEDTEGKRLYRFWDWAENEASWHVVFLISMYTDGASSEAVSDVIYDRFLLDPYAMIKVLAQEDSEIREKVIANLNNAVATPMEYNQLLTSIQMPDNARDAEWDAWKTMLQKAPEIDWTDVDWSQIDWSMVNTYKVDWNLVDWEKTDVKTMFRRMFTYTFMDSYNVFCDWFYEEAELQEVLFIARGTDGATAEGCSSVLYDHFAKNPYAVIQAIAREDDEQWRNMLASFVVFGADYPFDAFSQILGSEILPENATDTERAVWAEILSEAERQWGVVPTGDTIAIPAALLLASTLGLALLISKKRIFV